MSAEELERVIDEILSSRKYAHVSPEVVRRVAADALSAASGFRDAVKRARRKLHQAHGAFGAQVDHRRIEVLVASLEARPAESRDSRLEAARPPSREILSFHASTAERLDHMEELYAVVFGGGAEAAGLRRILDLGCGLNPFAIPWMGLPPGAEYHAVDLDTRLAGLIGRYLAALAQAGRATVGDALGGLLPAGPWDVVLLLKLLPTLERQERGAAKRLLASLDARRIVVSFPRASLGGRRKGMDDRYRSFVAELIQGARLQAEARELPGETVYVCARS